MTEQSAPIVPRYFDAVLAVVRDREPGLDPAASHRQAWGIAQDYEAALARQHTYTVAEYTAMKLAMRRTR